MASPLISFIILVSDRETILRRTVTAINQQSLTDFEIIVSDASSAGFVQTFNRKLCPGRDCLRYCDTQHDEPRWQRLKNAVNAAKGKYVLFVNTSQWLETDAAERLSDTAEENNLDMVEMRTARCIRGMTVRNENPILDDSVADRAISGEELRQIARFIGSDTFVSPYIHDKIFRRELLREALSVDFPGTDGCDEILVVQYLRHARSIMLMSYAGTNYNWQETEDNFNYPDIQDAKQTYTFKLLSGQNPDLAREELELRLRHHVTSLVRDMGWTREATTFFVGNELKDSFWRNAGINVTIDELMEAVYARNLRDDIFRIVRRLLR